MYNAFLLTSVCHLYVPISVRIYFPLDYDQKKHVIRTKEQVGKAGHYEHR